MGSTAPRRALLQRIRFTRLLPAVLGAALWFSAGSAGTLVGEVTHVPLEKERREEPRPQPEPEARLFVTLGGIYDSNIGHDRSPLADRGVRGELSARLKTADRGPAFAFEYAGIVTSYAGTDRWNRIRHRLEAEYERPVGGAVLLILAGEAATQVSTEDRELADTYGLGPGIEFEVASWLEMQAQGTFERKRPNDDPEQDESIFALETALEIRPLGDLRWTLEFGWETVASDSPSREYVRREVATGLRLRPSRRHAFEAELGFRPRDYRSRLAETPSGDEVLRRDDEWRACLSWTWSVLQDQGLELKYEYRRRTSTDPDKDFLAHRLELGLEWTLMR